MKRIITCFIILVGLVFPGCQTPAGNASETAASSESENQLVDIQPVITSTLKQHNLANGERYLVSDFETISLNEESAKGYPLLDESLKEFSKNALELQDGYIQMAKDKEFNLEPLGNGKYYSIDYKICVTCANQDYFSLQYDLDDGGFSSVAAGGASFDTKTGKRLVLSDVITSKKALKTVLYNQLMQAKSDSLHNVNIDEIVNDRVETADSKSRWYIIPDGLRFSFNISPEKRGSNNEELVTIYYEDYPELFTDMYKYSGGNYILPISYYYSATVKINHNKNKESIYVDGIPVVDHIYKDIAIVRGGRLYTFESQKCYSFESKLIHVADNKDYIYVFTKGDNERSIIYVFGLENDTIQFNGSVEASQLTYYINDGGYSATGKQPLADLSNHFYLENWVDSLSSVPIKKLYMINSKGVPESIEEFGTVLVD